MSCNLTENKILRKTHLKFGMLWETVQTLLNKTNQIKWNNSIYSWFVVRMIMMAIKLYRRSSDVFPQKPRDGTRGSQVTFTINNHFLNSSIATQIPERDCIHHIFLITSEVVFQSLCHWQRRTRFKSIILHISYHKTKLSRHIVTQVLTHK